MQAATRSANTLAMLLFAVATIVFVVGGIGIMNVLFVSVQERTPEIGILKAIGCPAGSILLEFLLVGDAAVSLEVCQIHKADIWESVLSAKLVQIAWIVHG